MRTCAASEHMLLSRHPPPADTHKHTQKQTHVRHCLVCFKQLNPSGFCLPGCSPDCFVRRHLVWGPCTVYQSGRSFYFFFSSTPGDPYPFALADATCQRPVRGEAHLEFMMSSNGESRSNPSASLWVVVVISMSAGPCSNELVQAPLSDVTKCCR